MMSDFVYLVAINWEVSCCDAIVGKCGGME
jgi:hypothetical protein